MHNSSISLTSIIGRNFYSTKLLFLEFKIEIIENKFIPRSHSLTLSTTNNSAEAETTKMILKVTHDSNLEKIALGQKGFM